MNVAVVGLGKIGLPLAVQYASKGHVVVGCDVNPQTVDVVNCGEAPFPGEHELGPLLKRVVAEGRLQAMTDTSAGVSEADAVVVVVPLFVDEDGKPDFDSLDSATQDIGRGLRNGTLVSYETTLPVGTTRGRFAPMLEGESGLVAGREFSLAFSPERVLTGRVFADLRRYPKLTGGLTAKCSERAMAFYEEVLDFDERSDLPRPNGVWDLGSCEASEFAKLAETTYRDVNIGLANQFARFAATNGIDVIGVIDACNSQPYSNIHRPGIAVGGHCIPVYPQLYLWNDPDATIVRAAREANWRMPAFAVSELERAHGPLDGQVVGVFGVSYRGGVKETAFSGVFPTVDALLARGALVVVHDPLYSDDELRGLGFKPLRTDTRLDAAIVQADHIEYSTFSTTDFRGARTILNGRDIAIAATESTIIGIGKPQVHH